jgi:hypothetical protein
VQLEAQEFCGVVSEPHWRGRGGESAFHTPIIPQPTSVHHRKQNWDVRALKHGCYGRQQSSMFYVKRGYIDFQRFLLVLEPVKSPADINT